MIVRLIIQNVLAMKYSKTLISLMAGATVLMFFTCSCLNSSVALDPQDKRAKSPRFAGGTFKGTKIMNGNAVTAYLSTTWKFLFQDNHRVPETPLPAQPVDLSHFQTREREALNATWLGHSSLMINMDGCRILIDPVFEKRISIFGPTRFNGEVPVDAEKIGPVDAVVISHNHYDHLNKTTIKGLKDKVGRFIVPLGVDEKLKAWGVPGARIVTLDWWEDYRLDDDLLFTATPAQHFSGRGLTDRNKTLWASWVISGPVHRIFFSGDSGYFPGFKRIGEKYGPFDMTFMECGAYNPAWHAVHMMPEETVQAHRDLGGDLLHPIHWGTFNLSLHPWFEPMERLFAEATARGVKIALPAVGGTTVYPSRIPDRRWWDEPMAQSLSGTGN